MAAALPPGPKSWPLVGSLPYLGREFYKGAMALSEELDSDIIHAWLGPNRCIFLNSLQAVKDAMSGSDLLDRPDMLFFQMRENTGIARASGGKWTDHRVLVEHLLTDGGADIQLKLHEEFPHLKKELAKIEGESADVSGLITTAANSVFVRKLVGVRYDYSDKEFRYVCSRFGANQRLMGSPWTAPLNIWPSLRHLPGNMFNWGSIQANIKVTQDFLQAHLEEHAKRLKPGEVHDILDAYLAEQRKQGADSTLTDEEILNALLDLMSAGCGDISTAVTWAILYMIKYPDIQKKVQAEIDANIAKDKLPSYQDRSSLPFTEATILEIQRSVSQVPLAVPHTNMSRDFTIRSFKIPKGTVVLPNTYAVHRETNIWKYPDEFNPGNFLGEDGAVVSKEGFLAHSFGRRNCPGVATAQTELFVFFASLLQSFTFSTPDGAPKPDIEAEFFGNRVPKPFKMCVRPR